MNTFELSPCIQMLYADPPRVPFAERVVRAAADGHTRVEMWEWRAHDLDALGLALLGNGVRLSLLTCDPDLNITDPNLHDAFCDAVDDSVRAARRLGCSNIVLSGAQTLPEIDRETQTRSIVAALRDAAPIAERHEVTLLLENLNSREEGMEDFFLVSTKEALAIVDAVGSGSLRMRTTSTTR